MHKTHLFFLLLILSLALSERKFSPPKGYYPLGKWKYIKPTSSDAELNSMDEKTIGTKEIHSNSTQEIEYSVDMEMNPGVVNIDAEEDVLSVQCDSNFKVIMKVSSFENVLKWVQGSKLFIGPGWECTKESAKYFIVMDSKVTRDNEVTFDTIPATLRDLVKHGNVHIKYFPPKKNEEPSPMSSKGFHEKFEFNHCINCEKKDYTIFNNQNVDLRFVAPYAEFITVVEVKFDFSVTFFSPFIKVRSAKASINGKVIINFGLELQIQHSLSNVERELLKRSLPSFAAGMFSVNPQLMLNIGIQSTISNTPLKYFTK